MPDDIFSQLDHKLAAARAAAEVPSPPPKTLFQRSPDGPDPLKLQNEFNLRLVEALRDALIAFRESASATDTRLREIEKELTGLRSLAERVENSLSRADQLAEETATSRSEFAQERQEQRRTLQRLQDEQRDLLRNLLEEQRVSIKQIALRTSEEAVLADRTRRATELRLEEFARRLEAGLTSGSGAAK